MFKLNFNFLFASLLLICFIGILFASQSAFQDTAQAPWIKELNRVLDDKDQAFLEEIEEEEQKDLINFNPKDPRYYVNDLSPIEFSKIYWNSQYLKLDLKNSKFHIGNANGIQIFFQLLKNNEIKYFKEVLTNPEYSKKFFLGLKDYIKEFLFKDYHLKFINQNFHQFILLLQSTLSEYDFNKSYWKVRLSENNEMDSIIFFADASKIRQWIQSFNLKTFENKSAFNYKTPNFENNFIINFPINTFSKLSEDWNANLFNLHKELIIKYIFYRSFAFQNNSLIQGDSIFKTEFYQFLNKFFIYDLETYRYLLPNSLSEDQLIASLDKIKSILNWNLYWNHYYSFLSHTKLINSNQQFSLVFYEIENPPFVPETTTTDTTDDPDTTDDEDDEDDEDDPDDPTVPAAARYTEYYKSNYKKIKNIMDKNDINDIPGFLINDNKHSISQSAGDIVILDFSLKQAYNTFLNKGIIIKEISDANIDIKELVVRRIMFQYINILSKSLLKRSPQNLKERKKKTPVNTIHDIIRNSIIDVYNTIINTYSGLGGMKIYYNKSKYYSSKHTAIDDQELKIIIIPEKINKGDLNSFLNGIL